MISTILKDILFINSQKEFEKGKRQHNLTEANIKPIVDTYKNQAKTD